MNEGIGAGFREQLERRTGAVVRGRRRVRRLVQVTVAGLLYGGGVFSSGWWAADEGPSEPSRPPGSVSSPDLEDPRPFGPTGGPVDLVAKLNYYDELLDREEGADLEGGDTDHWLMIALREDRRAGGRR